MLSPKIVNTITRGAIPKTKKTINLKKGNFALPKNKLAKSNEKKGKIYKTICVEFIQLAGE